MLSSKIHSMHEFIQCSDYTRKSIIQLLNNVSLQVSLKSMLHDYKHIRILLREEISTSQFLSSPLQMQQQFLSMIELLQLCSQPWHRHQVLWLSLKSTTAIFTNVTPMLNQVLYLYMCQVIQLLHWH